MGTVHRWNEAGRRIPKYVDIKPCPFATLFTTNPTWNGLGSNPGLRGEGRRITARAKNRLKLDLKTVLSALHFGKRHC